MSQLYIYLGAFGAVVVAFLGAYFKGRSSGKQSAELKHEAEAKKTKEKTEAIKAKIDTIVKESEKERNVQDADTVRARLKSSSVRSDKA